MINFLEKKFNKKIFLGALFVVLFFGGSIGSVKYTNAVEQGYISQLRTSFQLGDWSSFFGAQDEDEYGMTNRVGVHGLGNGEYTAPSTDFDVLLLEWASNFLTWTVSADLYEEVFFAADAREGITMAWETVRGFINMFYLLILIFLAIATILRINKFNDKKLFFNVIVSAVLVNFSMAITLVVIDFSNLIMVYFASAIQDINIANSFFSNMGYGEAFSNGKLAFRIGGGMMQFVVNIVIAVMLLFTGISLLIRLIAYWVLIILSPLAFFSIALPGSNGFNEWKDKLIYYSFYGPIMLFFIWLALALSFYLGKAFTSYTGSYGSDEFIKFLTSYITVIYLLYYGHDKSKSMASKAGDFAGKIMDKGGQYAVKAGKGAAMLTPIGWGAAAGMGAKSYAGSHLTGMKARMNEGKWTRLATEEGRKKNKEDMDHKGKMAWASSSRQDRLEMEAIERTKADLKDKVDLKNKDQILNLLSNGSNSEKKMAAQISSQEGWLDGDNLEKALNVADGNKLLTQSIKAGAGVKNKVSSMNYNLSKYEASAEDSDSEKAVHGNIKSLIMARAVQKGDKKLANEIDKKKRLSKEEVETFVNDKFKKGGRKKAVHYGMFEGADSMKKIADLLNEKMSMADKNELTTHFAEYLKDSNFSGARFSKGNNLNRLESMVNPIVTINLRNEGVIGNANTAGTSSNGQSSPIIEVASGRQGGSPRT